MEAPPPARPLFTSTLKRLHAATPESEADIVGQKVKKAKLKGHHEGQRTSGSASGSIAGFDHSTLNTGIKRGQLKLAVYWSQTQLIVHVFGARKLFLKNAKDCSSYIQVSVISSDGTETCSQTTRMICSDGWPHFNETMTFRREAFQSTKSRLFIVAHMQTTTRIKTLGSMSFGIVHLLNGHKEVNGWYHLLDEKLGREKHLAVQARKKEDVKGTGTDRKEDDNMNRTNSILPWISLHFFDIMKDSGGKYGFTVLDAIPVKIGTVHKGGVADLLGLHSGDAFLEVGGHSVAGVRSSVIVDLLKKADDPLRVLMQRMNSVPQKRSPLGHKSLNKLPPIPKQHIVNQSPKAQRKARRQVSPRIATLLKSTKPLVDRRLQRELLAKVAMRNARLYDHKCLQSSGSCTSTYSRASTAICESRRNSVKMRRGSLKRRSRDLNRGSLDWRRRSSRGLDQPCSDLTNNASARPTASTSDGGILSEIKDGDGMASDRSSSSSWESDVMASIPLDDLNALESVLDEPRDVLPASQESDAVNLNFPPTGLLTDGPSMSEENKRKTRGKATRKERNSGETRQRNGRVGYSNESMEIPFHETKQSVVWSRKVTPIPLDLPWRRLVYTGRVFVQCKKKKLSEMLLLLFSDVLLFTKALDGCRIKVVCCPLLINEISILDFHCKVAREFRITLVSTAQPLPVVGHGRTITLRAPTTKLKMTWHKFLQQRTMAIKCRGQHWTLGGGEKPGTVKTSTSLCTMDNNNDGQVAPVNHITTADRPKSLQMQVKPTEDQALIERVEEANPNKRKEFWEPLICTREKSKEAEDVVLTCDRVRGGYYLEDTPYQGFVRSACYDDDDDNDALTGGSLMKNNSSNSNCTQSRFDYTSSSCHSSPGFLRHHYSYGHLQSSSSAAFSAPSSPATKYPHQRLTEKHLLHRAEHSSPDLVSAAGGNKGRLRKSLFKRFSGNNKDDISGSPRAGSMREKKNPKKVVETKKKARRTLSMGDDHLLSVPGEPNSIDAVKEEEDEHPSELPSEQNSVNNRQMGGRKPRNIARDLKDKMRFLRRRHTDSSLRDTADKLDCEKSSLVQESGESDVRKWSDCFEILLHDKSGLEAFRKFLQTEFSDENIEFWLACEEYKALDTRVIESRAQQIFDDYVTIQAPREVNLDSRTRLETTANVNHPDESTFEHAQKRIEALMEKDSYPRFLRSDIYQKLLKEFIKKSK